MSTPERQNERRRSVRRGQNTSQSRSPDREMMGKQEKLFDKMLDKAADKFSAKIDAKMDSLLARFEGIVDKKMAVIDKKVDDKFEEFKKRMDEQDKKMEKFEQRTAASTSLSSNIPKPLIATYGSASTRSSSVRTAGSDTAADERRRRSLVLSGFSQDTPRRLITDFVGNLLKDKDVEFEGIFVPGKFASIAVVRFSNADKRDAFWKGLKDSPNPVFHDQDLDKQCKLFWNPDRTPSELSLRRLLGKIKKFLVTHNSHGGVQLFEAADVVMDARRNAGAVYIRRDKVAEVKDLKVSTLAVLGSKYHKSQADINQFLEAESQRV